MYKIGLTDFLFGTKWKPGTDLYVIFPMIVGSLYVTAGAIITGVPVGLMTAVFLSRFCPKWLHKILKPAIGETMAVIMVAGNQARIPDSILKGVRTLTANIVIEMGYATDLHREALIATGVVLFVFILLINLSFNLVQKR